VKNFLNLSICEEQFSGDLNNPGTKSKPSFEDFTRRALCCFWHFPTLFLVNLPNYSVSVQSILMLSILLFFIFSIHTYSKECVYRRLKKYQSCSSYWHYNNLLLKFVYCTNNTLSLITYC